MLWTPRTPTPAQRPLVEPLPRKLPISLHPSCVLALLPQNDPKWYDYSGRGNHGIVHGATPTAKGPDGFAWEFHGSCNWIDCGNLNLDWDNIDFTVRARAKLHAAGGEMGIIGNRFGAGAVNWWMLGCHPSGEITVELLSLVGVFYINTGFIATGQGWRDYIVRKTGRTVDVFIGRILNGTATVTGNMGGTLNELLIGRWFGTGQIWNGLIDLVLIYNQAWSPRPADANYLPEIDPHL